jgi:uncharacterized protein (TIGR01319 family)
MSLEDIKTILVTDCGSTTSKARLFKKIGNTYRFVKSGEAPTTVETPYEDITYGVRNAIREIEELTGHKILTEEGVGKSKGEYEGVDIYATTSSAGGGLQMMCQGVIMNLTAESAERAALGAGAIVMDVISIDDGRQLFEKIKRIRTLRPDMILIAGGTDGGTTSHIIELAEVIAAADPKPRFGASYKLPIVYAGNKDAREPIGNILAGKYIVKNVDNIRPTMEVENPEPARAAVHELFMEHVMSHAPGYNKLMKWTDVPIMPTPAGEGMMFKLMADKYNANVLGVGLGGATTNIYSVFDGRFVRTVSANLGMSYSICNVLKQAGQDFFIRWLPFKVDPVELRNNLYNKMIRPTTIPQTLRDLMIEHAVAREALRLGLQHHKFLARPLRGVLKERRVDTIFEQTIIDTYIDMMRFDWLCGTGGLLSHASRRVQSMLILIDGFQPEGVTELGQDSVFMMPHLGILSTVHSKAALQIFERDCLVRLGTCIALKGVAKKGDKDKIAVRVSIDMPNGTTIEEDLPFGTIKKIPLGVKEKATVQVKPQSTFDIGKGKGHELKTEVNGGVVGIIIDARGRPLILPSDEEERIKKLIEWYEALEAYARVPNARM